MGKDTYIISEKEVKPYIKKFKEEFKEYLQSRKFGLSFSKNLSYSERKWILEAIQFVRKFNIPIATNIYFTHCRNFREIGYCETGKDSKKCKNTIALSIYLSMYPDSYEHDFKEVCIHELLHTVPNRSKNPHKGSWKKYADLINSTNDGTPNSHNFWITEKFYKNNIRIAKEKALSMK